MAPESYHYCIDLCPRPSNVCTFLPLSLRVFLKTLAICYVSDPPPKGGYVAPVQKPLFEVNTLRPCS